jgi:hypothetical protein
MFSEFNFIQPLLSFPKVSIGNLNDAKMDSRLKHAGTTEEEHADMTKEKSAGTTKG